MNIEEAENILNEAVITEPSINGYNYISAEEINQAINRLLEERVIEQEKIKKLESIILEEKERLTKIIQDRNKKIEELEGKIKSRRVDLPYGWISI